MFQAYFFTLISFTLLVIYFVKSLLLLNIKVGKCFINNLGQNLLYFTMLEMSRVITLYHLDQHLTKGMQSFNKSEILLSVFNRQ